MSLFKPDMNPINKRRLELFRNHKRGYYSLWVFTLLFLISLAAEFVANDKPVLISYESSLYFPLFKDYSETEFGGEFETEADYRDPYVIDPDKRKRLDGMANNSIFLRYH